MKKIITSVALASSLFSGVALGENEGFFIGANANYATLKAGDTSGFSAYRFGILGGYKQFFTPELGARYYLSVESGSKFTKSGHYPQFQRLDIAANADVLYNFLRSEALEYGVFAGLSLDYAMNEEKLKSVDGPDGQGLDLGLNLGFRLNYAQNHGFELYSRLGLNGVKLGTADDNTPTPYSEKKLKTPYSLGLRYTYSF